MKSNDYITDDVWDALELAVEVHLEQEATNAVEEKFKTARIKLAMKEVANHD